MRFGMCGCFLPADVDEVTPEMCRRVRALGFSGIFTRFRANDPHTTPVARAHRLRDVLADNGVRFFQATGYWQNLVTPDEGRRAEAVRTLQAALALAGHMGARGIDTGPGSMNPDGPWHAHPDNWTALCRNQLVKSLKECAKAAEDAGVFLSLEGHHVVTLASASVTREILDEVGSPWVRCDYDSANWITGETVHDTAAALNRDFDLLGGHIASCHAKDCWIDTTSSPTGGPPEPVETAGRWFRGGAWLVSGCPGKGSVDFRTLFRRMEALSPDHPVIVEGARTEDLPAVSALFHDIARELGIHVRS